VIPYAHLLVMAPIGITVGILIGTIGIGGVLLVPSLVYIRGMEIHVAIATCMFTYLFSGAVGAVEYARRRSIRWQQAIRLCVGAMPGAYLGAATSWLAPAYVLEILIGFLVLLSGVQALRMTSEDDRSDRELGTIVLVAIGLVTGFGSAMSGTGGPLILVPLLIWLKISPLAAVGLSQVIQLPVAALATTGHLAHGSIDFPIGAGIAVLLMVGVFFGARIAHRASPNVLKRYIAFALLVVGAFMLLRNAFEMLSPAAVN
jgi:uncharacterized membrane protein YfcA